MLSRSISFAALALCAHCASPQQPRAESHGSSATADVASSATSDASDDAPADALAAADSPANAPEATVVPAEPEAYATSNDHPPTVRDPSPELAQFRDWAWTTATSYGEERIVLRDVPAVPAVALGDAVLAHAAIDRVVRRMLPDVLTYVYGFDDQAPSALRRPVQLVSLRPLADAASIAAARRALSALARDAARASAQAAASVEQFQGDTNTAEYASVTQRAGAYRAVEALLHETLPALLAAPPGDLLDRALGAAKAIAEAASLNDLNGTDTLDRALHHCAELLRALAALDRTFAPVPALELRAVPGAPVRGRGQRR